MLKPRYVVSWILAFALAGVETAAADPAKEAAASRAEVQKIFGFVPGFIKAIPDVALPGAWGTLKTLEMNPATALSGKQKELIGLAVAAQIPCEYCIQVHTEFAKLNGATQAEIGEAVAMAGLTRHWSTFFNGILPDEAKFRSDLAKAVENTRKVMSGKAQIKDIAVVDAKSAYQDIAQYYGPLVEIMKKFPPEAIVAAWRAMKSVEMAETKLDGRTKSLISVAVAAQIPCKYCVIADTEFAKLAGASDRELSEAIAMASHVRNWSTMLNGLQVDKVAFKQDLAKMVKAAKKAEKAPPKAASNP